MISTNDLSMFILYHNLNGLRNKNLCLIQYVMRLSDMAAKKCKRVCKDLPNHAIITKSAKPGKIQLMFIHAAVRNKFLGESVVAFALTGYIIPPSVISLKIKIAFATDGENIRLLIAEVPLHASAGNLT